MMTIWIVVGVLVVLLGGAAIYDRRIRARRRRLADSHDASIAGREVRRSVRGSRLGATPDLNTWKPPER